jgi:hypothetical protein
MKMMKNFAVKIGVSALALLLGACSVQTTSSLLASRSDVVDVNAKILTDVPFAYDTVVDTISYNSCAGNALNNSGLHGIKIGANEGFVDSTGSGAVKAGIKLRSDFLLYLAQNVKPTFPNTTIIPSQIQYILENSDKNKELQIQYAVRFKSDLKVVQDVIDPSKAIGQYVIGRDGVYEIPLLSQDPILSSITKQVQFGPNQTVISEGPRTYNLGTGSQPDPLEASFGFSANQDTTLQPQPQFDDGTGAGEEHSDRIRQKFNLGEYILTMTYGNQSSVTSGDDTSSFGLNSPRRATGAPANRAYGRSFELSFISKNSSVSSQRRNILNQITEKTLDTGSSAPGASWSCEHYVIMKTSEWNNKKANQPACAEINSDDLAASSTGPALKAKLARLRRHYPESQWGIGFMVRENTTYVQTAAARAALPICLVNKAVDCYFATKGIILAEPETDVGVNYNATISGNLSECYLSRYSQMGVSYIGNLTGDNARRLGRCPQYASICVRTSTSF